MEDIEFQPYEWKEFVDKDNKLEFYVFAFDKDSNRELIRVKGFPYFCMIQLPNTVNGIYKKWTETNSKDVVNYIKKRLENAGLITTNFCDKKNVFFRDSRSSYITAFFNNKKGMRLCYSMFHNKRVNIFSSGYDEMTGRYVSYSTPILLNVWENDITADTKLMAVRDLEKCNWTTCKAEEVPKDKRVSKLDREYICKYNTLKKIDRDYVIYPMIASVDIEVNSKRKLCFPDPWKTSDDIYMINIVFQRLGKPETRSSHCIITTDCNDVEGVNIHRVTSEKAAVYKMAELFLSNDTSFVIQWNGMGFDWRYISIRMTKKDIELPDMSLIKGDKTWIYEKEWESKAYKSNFNYIPQTSGMIHVDMMIIVKRMQRPFMKYTLNFIAKELLGRTKHDLSAFEMFTIYQDLVAAKRQYKRDPSDRNKKILDKKVDEMTKTVKYCEQDCILPLDIMIHLDTYQELIQNANISCVNIIDLYTKGAQIKGLNKMYQYIYKHGYVMNYVDSSIERFDGAYVFKPEPGFHQCVICLDFQSLYPSIIIDNNLCLTTIIPEEKWGLYSPKDYVTHMIEIKKKVNPDDKNCKEYIKIIKEIRVHKGEALLVLALNQLLDERAAIRKLQALEKDKNKKSVYNCRQLAIKLLANSLYGLTGMDKKVGGRLTMKEVSAITTSTGKMHIKEHVKRYIEEVYGGKLIYGDTDSGFVYLGITDPIECLYYGIRLCHELNGGPELVNPQGLNVTIPACKGIFKNKPGRRLKLDFEKGMMVLLMTKKRYSYLIIDKLGYYSREIEKILNKGNMAAKRERCTFVRGVFLNIVHMILMRKDLYEVLCYLKTELKKLFDGQVDVKDLCELRNMGRNYKQPNYPLRVLYERLISVGKDVRPGDRLELIIIELENPKLKLGHKYRLYEEYLDCDKTGDVMKIDYMYYVSNLLSKQLDQVIGFVFGKEVDEKYSKIKLNISAENSITLKEPCKMLVKMMQRGISFNKVIKAVKKRR